MEAYYRLVYKQLRELNLHLFKLQTQWVSKSDKTRDNYDGRAIGSAATTTMPAPHSPTHARPLTLQSSFLHRKNNLKIYKNVKATLPEYSSEV